MVKTRIILISLTSIMTVSFLAWIGLGFFADADMDGVLDSVDNCPFDSNYDQSDFDMDKLGDMCDTDDDNDGIHDSVDVFDTDPHDWADFDFDGIGSQKDQDDDNDGILDNYDSEPILYSEALANIYFKDIQTCAEISISTSRLICYSEFFSRLTKTEENNSNALELSIALSKVGTIDDCHFISHEIGHAAFDKTRSVYSSLNGIDGTMCRGGYFHGVLAAYFHNMENDEKEIPESYNTICDNLIGSSNYQDCIHGMGHGLVHYFEDDLNSSIELCHSMSFYQGILCMKGVMMQYTDNQITRNGISKNTISNICDSVVAKSDYIECAMSTGTSIAFFTNHDFNEGSKLCRLIENTTAQNYCLEGLKLEITDSENYEKNPLTEDIREKFQPQKIPGTDKIIDIRSPAIISDFEIIPKTGTISFTIDSPQYVIMYIPNEFISSQMIVSVNGQVPLQLDSQSNLLGQDVSMIRFIPQNSGTVLINSFKN